MDLTLSLSIKVMALYIHNTFTVNIYIYKITYCLIWLESKIEVMVERQDQQVSSSMVQKNLQNNWAVCRILISVMKNFHICLISINHFGSY